MRTSSASRIAAAVLTVGLVVTATGRGVGAVGEDPGTDAEVTIVGENGDGLSPTTPPVTERVQLVDLPPGCLAPDLPDIVFVGTVVERDFRTARFRIEQVRAGDETEFAVDGLIDVRYGLDVQFLDDGVRHLVSARRHPLVGVLFSQVRDPAPAFGGDDVVGIEGAEIECPAFEDPVMTLFPDGSPVPTSVFAPMFADRSALMTALLIPVGVALGLIFVLAMLRLGLAGVVRGVRAAMRPRAVRAR